jgi:hypothetical protein
LFVLHVPTVPITIDGRKASFEDLVPGQKIEVQYNLEENGGIRCIAHRIDARAPPPSLSLGGQPHPARLAGHWRYAAPGVICDYLFAGDGSFRGELAVAGEAVRHFSGNWSVAGDQLNYVITKSDSKDIRIGKEDPDKLVQLTNDYYVVETRHGTQHKYARLQ